MERKVKSDISVHKRFAQRRDKLHAVEQLDSHLRRTAPASAGCKRRKGIRRKKRVRRQRIAQGMMLRQGSS